MCNEVSSLRKTNLRTRKITTTHEESPPGEASLQTTTTKALNVLTLAQLGERPHQGRQAETFKQDFNYHVSQRNTSWIWTDKPSPWGTTEPIHLTASMEMMPPRGIPPSLLLASCPLLRSTSLPLPKSSLRRKHSSKPYLLCQGGLTGMSI